MSDNYDRDLRVQIAFTVPHQMRNEKADFRYEVHINGFYQNLTIDSKDIEVIDTKELRTTLDGCGTEATDGYLCGEKLGGLCPVCFARLKDDLINEKPEPDIKEVR